MALKLAISLLSLSEEDRIGILGEGIGRMLQDTEKVPVTWATTGQCLLLLSPHYHTEVCILPEYCP